MSISTLRRPVWILLLVLGTAVVLLLAFIPIVRVHLGWEDEVYWFSTCLSMVRHGSPIPAILADFPGTQSPLRFYGPTLFWLGALALRVFGATLESWRAFTFAGGVAFLIAIAVLFRRLRNSWLLGAAAAFVFSLSIGNSFGFSLPGRPDGWGVAVLVLAMVAAAQPEMTVAEPLRDQYVRWLLFGLLLGVAATTSPRTWPLIASMIVLLPLLIERQKLRMAIVACGGILLSVTAILLPLRLSPFGFLMYVRSASSNDTADVSPLLGGSWGFGHAMTQTLYYGAVLVIIGVLQVARWREQSRFARWLVVAGLLNLLLSLVLLSRTLNMPTYWGLPLEISALMALTMPLRHRREFAIRFLGIALFAFMGVLRVAREIPVFAHWKERDPLPAERVLAASVPSGSLVYGPTGDYFFFALADGSDYRYLRDSKNPGRSSIPGVANTPAPMTDACTRAAYLTWPIGVDGQDAPNLPHASATYLATYHEDAERVGRLEGLIERVPGGRADREDRSFSIYRLRVDPNYCRARLIAAPNSR